MRRRETGRSGALAAANHGEQGFWPSYADMMSAVALILFFLMLLSYIQNLITGNDLQNTQELLEDTRSRLSETQRTLSDTETALTEKEQALAVTLREVAAAEDQLGKITIDLDEARLTLTEQQKTLDQQAKDLKKQQDDLAAQDKLLSDQEALIGRQAEYVKAASEELLAMRSQMQTIAVLRLSILNQIRDSFVRVTGDASKVSIANNGNIILSESILFDIGSSEIKSEAEPALDQLVTVFEKFLADDENAKYVDSIVISGHTDSTGTDESNRILSTDRANSVLNYLLSAEGGRLNRYASYFCAAGYGETRPVDTNLTSAGRSNNRRIEISIILKDDSVMEIVQAYLDLELPQPPQ
ncbi:MAG: OmpA family protein [Oscillospiraceae bacterium]|nr:OmpA family protein [Oscillospiraceae bacterium]